MSIGTTIKRLRKEKRISDITKEAMKHHEVGHMDEVISTLRLGLKEFPNSYVLMITYVTMLFVAYVLYIKKMVK